MNAGLRALTQVSLTLLLALSLGSMTAVPSQAEQSNPKPAIISPPAVVYDLGDPERGDVKTTITWHDAEAIAAIEDDEGELGENHYSVIPFGDGRSTLTILKSYLEGKLTAAGDGVVLTINFASGKSATLTITAVRYPSVSPAQAEYDLDDPPDFMKVSIGWGRASTVLAITDGDHEELDEGCHYIVLLNTLLILNDYLKARLKEDGDRVELTVDFNAGDPATLAIEAIKTYPHLKATPNPAAYNLFPPTDVEIIITWHRATRLVSIVDDNGYSLQSGRRPDYTVVGNTLTILHSYLQGRLTKEGDTTLLTIAFDIGRPIDFTIRAVDMTPYVTPERAEYDLDHATDVNTNITWGAATEVVSIRANDNNLSPENHYTVVQTAADEAMLTILNDYLADKLRDAEHSVELRIKFGFEAYPGLEHDVIFTVTAIGTHPGISPLIAPYDLRSPTSVNTTITWRNATEVLSVVDSDGNTLQGANEDEDQNDYRVIYIDEDTARLTIMDTYLAGNLTNLRGAGDSVVLTIEFDFGPAANFTITAVSEYPSVHPQTADYDLDERTNVETVITWQNPTAVVAITDDDNRLIPEDHYTVGETAEGEAALTILQTYLESKLKRERDTVVLTIEFTVGYNLTFDIVAVRSPAIYPAAAIYDLDDRADFIETSITWASASEILNITDRNGELTQGQGKVHEDYMVLGSTLVITDGYLRTLNIDDRAELSIGFDFGDPVTFTIRAIGTHPEVFPLHAVYDLDDPAAVHTTITWGAANNIASVMNVNDGLVEGVDYWLTDIETGVSANLTISEQYLARKIKRYDHKVVLTLGFDIGEAPDVVITALKLCFIATAAYGTPMAEEIQILREFRDGYLLTNPPGRLLVDSYYRVSPPLAAFITGHPTLKPIVRAGLMPAVVMSAVVLNTTPAEKMAIVGLLLLVSAALAVWPTGRLRRGRTIPERQSRTPSC